MGKHWKIWFENVVINDSFYFLFLWLFSRLTYWGLWGSSEGFPHSSVSKESTSSTGDPGLTPGSGRSPGEGNGNPLQCSCLENSMDRGVWQATVHGVARVRHDLATKPHQSRTTNYYSNSVSTIPCVHTSRKRIRRHDFWGDEQRKGWINSKVHFIVIQWLSHVWLFATPWTASYQDSCPSPSPRACSNSCPLSQQCHPTISSSVAPFSACPQSFPALESSSESAFHIRLPQC